MGCIELMQQFPVTARFVALAYYTHPPVYKRRILTIIKPTTMWDAFCDFSNTCFSTPLKIFYRFLIAYEYLNYFNLLLKHHLDKTRI